MEWAALGVGIVALLGGLAQYFNTQKQQGASKERLKQLEQEFNTIKPPGYDVSIHDLPDDIKKKIPEPQYDFSKFTPEQYKVVAKYSPQLAPYIQEANPQLVKYSETGEKGIAAQKDVLRQLQDQANNQGITPGLQAKMNLANMRGQAEAQSREQSLLQDFQRRGQLGSGMQFAAELQGGSNAMNNAYQASQNAAIEAERERLSALAQSGALGGQMANQDMSMQERNAAIMNAFNQRTAAAQQQYQNQAANTLNEGQRYNLGQAQEAADRNVGEANAASKYNQGNQNTLQNQLYNARVGERNYQRSVADWQEQQRKYADQLRSQAYQDQLARYNAKQGIANNYNTLGAQSTAAQNAAIQGGEQGIMSGISEFSRQQQADEDRRQKQEELDLRKKQLEKGGYAYPT